MPRAIKLQTTFNSGELDPRLASRIDVKQYYQGAATAKNVLSLPQGGLKRRPGMSYQATLSGAAAIRMAAFSFNTEQDYLIVFSDNQIEVFRDGVSQATVPTTYTAAQLFELNWTQSADTMIIVHEDHPPATLTRGLTHTAWTLADITFKTFPAFDYDDDYEAATFTLAADRDRAGKSIVVTASTAVFDAKHVGGIFDAVADGERGVGRITAVASGTSATIKVLDTWLDGSTGEGDVVAGNAYIGEPVWSAVKGYARTVTFYQGRLWFGGSTKRPQTVWGSVSNDFFNFDQGSGLDDESISITLDTDQVNAIQALYSGRHLQIFTTGGEFNIPEDIITPEKVTVKRHTNYGSGSIRPKSIDGATLFIDRTGKAIREFVFSYTEDSYTSVSASLLASHLLNSPVDMDLLRGTAQDDANYFYIVNADGTMAVFNTLRDQEVSGWTQWITNGHIEAVCVVLDEVYFITRRNINGTDVRFLERSDSGSFLDGSRRSTPATSFFAATAQALIALDTNAFLTAVYLQAFGRAYDSSADADGTFWFDAIENGITTKELALMQIVSGAQGADLVENIAVVSSHTATGLEHLNGVTCRVKADGAVLPDAVPASGQVTLSRSASAVEVGLGFDVLVKTLPLNMDFQNGPILTRDKRIIKVILNLYESLGLYVDGALLPDRRLGRNILDTSPPPYTGLKELNLMGWSELAQVEISQRDPLPMLLLGVSLEVEA